MYILVNYRNVMHSSTIYVLLLHISIFSGPSWLKNLYFAYLLVLRAITKMESYWIKHKFYTGNSADDTSVNEKILQIVEAAK